MSTRLTKIERLPRQRIIVLAQEHQSLWQRHSRISRFKNNPRFKAERRDIKRRLKDILHEAGIRLKDLGTLYMLAHSAQQRSPGEDACLGTL